MLNPSTADATTDDPTIKRCIAFAKNWGFGSLIVRNLFAYRATDKRELLTVDSPTGGKRGDIELSAVAKASMILVAWGEFVPFHRDIEALKLFGKRDLYHLGLSRNGKPRHPGRLRANTQPTLWQR